MVEGRDIGTVVFPDAQLKIFLTARDEKRAQRRFAELQSKGVATTFAEVQAAMQERDQRDMNRSNSPTVAASDAIVVDTSDCTEFEVVEQVERLIQSRKSA